MSKFAWQHLRFPKAAQVAANDPVMLCEQAKLLVPHSTVCHASMEQQEWLPLPLSFNIQVCAVDCDKTRSCFTG
jgi:hypothetical protein